MSKAVRLLCCSLILSIAACSRQQGDWEKSRASNTTDAYEQFLKKYPHGEFSKEADARLKALYEERDWQKARDLDTPEAYQEFLKQHPQGRWTEEAHIRLENFNLAQAPGNASSAAIGDAAPGGANAGATPAASGPAAGAAPDTSARPQAASSAASRSAKGSMGTAQTAAGPVGGTRSAGDAAAGGAPIGSSGHAASSGLSKGYSVQLGAFTTAAAADRRWTHLQKSHARLLAGRAPAVSRGRSRAGVLYRLQVTGLSGADARAICKSLKSHAQACFLIRPAKRARISSTAAP